MPMDLIILEIGLRIKRTVMVSLNHHNLKRNIKVSGLMETEKEVEFLLIFLVTSTRGLLKTM